jgi:hypothetical protein
MSDAFLSAMIWNSRFIADISSPLLMHALPLHVPYCEFIVL